MENARVMGDRLMAGVRKLAEKHPVIGDVRGLGLMLGIEFVTDRTSREPNPHVVEELVLGAFQKGLLLLGAGPSALRLAPPLVVDAEDVDTALRIIDDVLSAV
jgi:4-aminobutyrate aminotransferase